MLQNLPWQALITGLIVLIALGYVTRRWWPGGQTKGACHDTGGSSGQPATGGGCGSGGCADCTSNPGRGAGDRQAPPIESEIRIHRSKPQ